MHTRIIRGLQIRRLAGFRKKSNAAIFNCNVQSLEPLGIECVPPSRFARSISLIACLVGWSVPYDVEPNMKIEN